MKEGFIFPIHLRKLVDPLIRILIRVFLGTEIQTISLRRKLDQNMVNEEEEEEEEEEKSKVARKTL